MGIRIKKISRNAVISLVSMGGLILALAGRFLFGGGHININQVEKKFKGSVSNSDLIKVANADVVDSCDSCDSCSTGSCDSSGSGGSCD